MKIYKKLFHTGYYTEDGYFPLTPACKRAVEVAIEAVSLEPRLARSSLLLTPPRMLPCKGKLFRMDIPEEDVVCGVVLPKANEQLGQ